MDLTLSLILLLFGVAELPLVTEAQIKAVDSPVSTSGCGQSKGCLHSPMNCVSPACESVATWKPSAVEGFMDFELMAKSNGWVALGLSTNALMGDDSVMHCVIDATRNNTAQVSYSYNYRTTSGLYNGLIPAGEINTTLVNTSASYTNGEIHCRFSRRIEADGAKVFTLNSSYYLFLGFGPATAGVIKQHNKDPLVSSTKVDVTKSTSDMSTTSPSTPSTNSTTATNTTSDGNGTTTNSFSDDAGAMVTYQLTSDGSQVVFTLSRPLPLAATGWVAVGFSTDQSMKDDSVLECIRKADGSFVTQNSYNNYQSNQALSANESKLGIADATKGSYENGMLKCVITRQVKVNNARVFDLDKQYYLFVAQGPLDAAEAKYYHSSRKFSASQVDVRVNSGVQSGGGGRCDICLKRAHGILMITAWVLIVSTSIIIARYYKSAWPGKKLCTTDVWFTIHRILMILALACTISGFVIIFVVNSGKLSTYQPASQYPSYFWVHAPLGIVVMILVIINPVMAMFRCHPNTKYRPIFNWLHWLVGTSCHIIALITIFFGAKIGELYPADRICHIAIFWILIAFVGFHVFVEIILSIDKCVSEMRSKQSFQVQYEMSKPGEVPRILEPSVSRCSLIFRYIILVIYFLVVLTLWLAMVILIGSGNIGKVN